MKPTEKHPTSNIQRPTSNDGILASSYPTPAQELLDAGKALGAPIRLDGYAPCLIVPEHYKLVPLEPAKPLPVLDYIKSAVELTDVESFIAYVKRYQTAETVIFATLPLNGAPPSFTAVFDYHAAKADGAEQQARRVAHKATYPCPFSVEWLAWTERNGKPQPQMDFVNFIEANAIDVVAPDSATMMEMVMNFEARTEVVFTSKVDRTMGAKVLLFNEKIDANSNGPLSSMKVPEFLELRLPVFEGGEAFPIRARMEYRPRDGALKIAYHLLRPVDVLREALASLDADIEAATGIAPMSGRLVG
jgi:uncharacterized protein YfdQ (DUF2303 family)